MRDKSMMYGHEYLKKYRIIMCYTLVFVALSVSHAHAEDWQWQLKVGQVHQDYQERDATGLTTDGVLNTETGSLPSVEINLTNTLDPIDLQLANGRQLWSPYGKFAVRYARGETDYDGYLQSGNELTPYQTNTDNQMWRLYYDLGLTHALNANLSMTPLLSISHQRWRRELTEYTEDFRHTAILAGANIDWQPSLQVPLILKVQAKVGKIVDSNIDVPKLGLNQDIGNAKVTQLGIEAQYSLSKQLSMIAGVSRQTFKYEQSDVQNGYQYPDSESKQKLWQVGLGYEF